ncbi:NAD(P)H-hydrate dehydratase [Candidatus Saccharibacteria bacterium]|nr:NAD(P)H-hydrate dehydratase [Candidatus Saccharibacteria bacterium]
MKLERDSHGHKGTFGTVLAIGGSYGELVMFGGIVFAAKACLRSGAGKVIIALPEETAAAAIGLLPEAIVLPIDQARPNLANLRKYIDSSDVIVVGPGWANADYQEKVLKVVLEARKETIIDAGALHIIATNNQLAKMVHNKCILTPHSGEMTKLNQGLGCSDAKSLSVKTSATVVHKSFTTELTDGDRSWTLNKPNSVLATAGSGDVLAGMISGLLAQYLHTYNQFDIVKTAIKEHSKAGEQLVSGSLASELIDKIVIKSQSN